ncbi:hypothetical protein MCOR27_007031 [Pyricularia oryzae]|uniref:SURF6-domain-containing protein n=2 Tax=Pyricularia TaxID=48558 RepID=A0ABQ8NF73_PYRGI|nr:uncharacterized protein MGG_00840 [Pyricularia oryzae 70-15]KAH8840533.1 hypothetical protein MCOR01_007237 [Pyricularia oryzae]KAI6296083.1 hypothetical protein MCOR33_007203 [Pyricularia grisea]EHA48555.1 hypothetical protein MGG_00840 [Pyricularia oryzae 70-15]KAH9434173.1 hypothetical protein MCOR02_012550 [Pyricularia oryzae]KAI6262884.1 hypothetical protein MCOR19_000868 [Pyricularia oryzae]
MSENDLQERLRESAKAFDGLLSLIPAQIYYGDQQQNDQWKRKKHTKAEKKAAKLGKLDPDSEKNRTVQEVLEERARSKRKLEDVDSAAEDEAEQDGDDISLNLEGIEMEQPLKRQKTVESESEEGDEEEAPAAEDAEVVADDDGSKTLSAKDQKKLLKKQKKLEKLEKKAAKTKKSKDATDEDAEPIPTPKKASEAAEAETPRPTTEEDDRKPAPDSELAPIELAGLETNDGEGQSEASSGESKSTSPVFDTDLQANNGSVEPASAATSIASAAPSEKAKPAKLPSSTSDAFKARLAARIEELRKARKADGAEGKPAMTRQELIESRRQKQAQRKAHKQEVRRLAKEEADRKREEALASARTSPGSFMSPLRLGGSDAGSDSGTNNFAFGRIAFADGQQMAHDLSYVKDEKKKKGPSDPKTALAKLEAQKKRMAGLDEDKRKEVLEKETWLAARRRAEGEKIRDDETLLRKAVKRKEQAKKKSEREWGERKAGVEKAIRERQKKREDNLRKRRDEKAAGKMGKKKGGPTRPGGGGKKNRPGFEGAGFGGSKRK